MIGQEMRVTIPDDVWIPLEKALRGLTPENPLHLSENAKDFGDGSERWVSFSNRALFNEKGECTGYLSVGQDITQRRQTAVQLQRQQEALQQSEKLAALGSLLAGVAHELNNPLSIVLARAFMLEEEVTDPAIRSSVVPLRAAAERCARIVQTFLAVARQKPREHKVLPVEPLLSAALEMLAYNLRTAGIEITCDWQAGNDATVEADENALHQVFLNLIVNAQQALQDIEGVRILSISTRRYGQWIEIAIYDNGPGVPKAIRSRIFEPFFTTKPLGAGTGIGLAVCHGIITAHGGTIKLHDRPGGGACFVVRLPFAPVGDVTREEPRGPDKTKALDRAILIVDDEPDILEVLASAFVREGYFIATATDGQEGIRALDAGHYDLVITDLRMPVQDGRALLRAIAARPADQRPAVIVLTGDTLNVTSMDLRLDPPPTLLEKPFDLAALRDVVRQLLACKSTFS
jgi:signal transduction histidine kinase